MPGGGVRAILLVVMSKCESETEAKLQDSAINEYIVRSVANRCIK